MLKQIILLFELMLCAFACAYAALSALVEWLHNGPELAALVAALFAVAAVASASGAVLKISE